MAKKIVDKSPKLRALKSQSQGEKPLFSASDGGKGSAPRPGVGSEEYKANFDQIDWSHNRNTKKSYRVKINGVYQDQNEDD